MGGKKAVSRRGFLKGVAASAGAAAVASEKIFAVPSVPPAQTRLGPGSSQITLNVNGRPYTLQAEPRLTLLNALRDRTDAKTGAFLDLTGTKKVCDRGSCGACTVIVDGRPMYSCSMLALEAQGRKVVTVEGLAREGRPHPVQQAFVECDGLMCGFCTPGFVVSSVCLLEKNPRPTLAQIQRGLNGNLCRCGTYSRVFEAVELAASRMQRGG